MFSHAITASGVLSVRLSIALAMTGAMNLRMLGPTAHVTYGKNGRQFLQRLQASLRLLLTMVAEAISSTTSAS
jgi:hypothetical protein